MDNSKIYVEGGSSRFYAKNDSGDITLTIFALDYLLPITLFAQNESMMVTYVLLQLKQMA